MRLLQEQAFSQSLLLLGNTPDTKKKVPRDAVLLSFYKATTLSEDSECDFKWEMHLKSDIVCKTLGKRIKLDKYIKDHHQNTKEIFRYIPFPAGGAPKVLVMRDEKHLKFLCSGPNKQHIYSLVAAVLTPGICSLRWVIKFVAGKDRLEPSRLAV